MRKSTAVGTDFLLWGQAKMSLRFALSEEAIFLLGVGVYFQSGQTTSSCRPRSDGVFVVSSRSDGVLVIAIRLSEEAIFLLGVGV